MSVILKFGGDTSEANEEIDIVFSRIDEAIKTKDDLITKTDQDIRDLITKATKTQEKIETVNKEQINKINFTLAALRTANDVLALYQVSTGKSLDLQAYVLFQMGIAQVRQMRAQAASLLASGTPYGLIAGAMILSAIPMLTAAITFSQSQLSKTKQYVNTQMTEWETERINAMR